MKKLVAILLAGLMLFALVSCVGTDSGKSKAFSVVCTTFPSYDWVKNILGERLEDFDLKLLLDNGVDLHNYQATADDIVTIHNCDMFVYVGGPSDSWVEDVIFEAANEDMVVVNLVSELGEDAKLEEEVEGMEEEEEEEEEEELDEHIWLSLKNASVLVGALNEAICKVDAGNSDTYDKNAESYLKQLDKLNEKYDDMTENAKFDTVLFGDRFPFRYLVDDYDLNYYAAFAGCSAETEASFETVSFLAKKVDELSLPAILTIEGSDGKIAETIAENAKSNPEILSLNSMQSITSKDVEEGVSYLSIMESNLYVFDKALN